MVKSKGYRAPVSATAASRVSLNAFFRFSIERPRVVLGLALLLTAVAAPGLLRLELRTDGEALVPAEAQEVLEDAEVRARFGLRDRIAVVVEDAGQGGIYDHETLALVERLSTAFSDMAGVGASHVESLATEPSDRVRPGTLEFRPWLEPGPDGSEFDLTRLRADLEEARIYSGTLIATDRPASATAILIGVPEGVDRTAFAGEVQRVVDRESEQAEEEVTIHVVGPPVAEALLGLHVLEDLTRLLPLAIVLMAVVFWLAFRSLAGVLLPLAEVGACLVLTLGTMGWAGAPVYLTVAVLPVLLTAVGVADELHVFTRFLREERADTSGDRRRVVAATMRGMARPVVLTSATTAAGFLAFAVSPVDPVRVFGVFMALGVVYCMLWSLCVTPAVLSLSPSWAWRSSASARPSLLGNALARLVSWAHRRRFRVRVLALSLAMLGVVLALRVRIQDSWVAGFRSRSAFAEGTRSVNQRFGGTHLLQVELDAEAVRLAGTCSRADSGPFEIVIPERPAEELAWLPGHEVRLRPAFPPGLESAVDVPQVRRVERASNDGAGTRLRLVRTRLGLDRLLPTAAVGWHYEVDGRGRLVTREHLPLIQALEHELAQVEGVPVGRVSGPYEHLATMNFMRRQRDPLARRVTGSEGDVDATLKHYLRVRGRERFERVITSDASAGLVTVFVKDADFRAVDRLLEVLGQFAEERLRPRGIEVSLGGDLARSQAMVGGIVRTQTLSLGLGLVLVLIAAGVALRSLRYGLLCALPCAAAVLCDFALLGGLGIPLGVATSMFAGMTIAIGIDYAIHLVVSYRRRRAAGSVAGAAWSEAAREAGPAVVIDALALGLSFGVLILSEVPANARLGALMVASLCACLLGSLLLLPALTKAGHQ